MCKRDNVDTAQVFCGEQSSFNMLGSLNACRAKRIGCEAHEPLIELVDGSCDVGLPEVGFVRIDSSRLHDSIRSSVLVSSAIAVTVFGAYPA